MFRVQLSLGRAGRVGCQAPALFFSVISCFLSFLGMRNALCELGRMLFTFRFFLLELNFFPPKSRLMIYDAGISEGPGFPRVYK